MIAIQRDDIYLRFFVTMIIPMHIIMINNFLIKDNYLNLFDKVNISQAMV